MEQTEVQTQRKFAQEQVRNLENLPLSSHSSWSHPIPIKIYPT